MSSEFRGLDPSDPGIERLREIWELTQDPDTEFPAKLASVFEKETERLDFPIGFLTQIDLAAETQTIELAHGSHEQLQQGKTHPLSETYCRETIRSTDAVFTIDDAFAEGWDDDPAYERFGLGSYLGVTLEFDGTIYGTLCFARSHPRDSPVIDGERMLAQLLGSWASNELQNRLTQSRLERQTEELASTISHDLRNPLAIAQGHVENLNGSVRESLETIERAHQRMNEIIGDMLALARIDEPVENPEAVELRTCASNTWSLVETGEAMLTFSFEEGTVLADEGRLKHLFENVFRNAVEHGNGELTVEVGLLDSGFYIADDGPGIPPSERTIVFDPGYSTRPDGTGLGLSIVRRIADAHGWDVTITESANGGARFDITGVDFVSPQT